MIHLAVLFPRRADHREHLNACNGCRDSGELEAPTLALCPSLPSMMIEREETRPRHRLQTGPSTTRYRFMTTASGERQTERGAGGGEKRGTWERRGGGVVAVEVGAGGSRSEIHTRYKNNSAGIGASLSPWPSPVAPYSLSSLNLSLLLSGTPAKPPRVDLCWLG